MFTFVSFRVLLLLLVISDFVDVGFVMINFYSVLGVAKNAAGGDIRKAYLRLCRRWHPDKNHPGKFEKCNAKMGKINRAFHTLSDANLKENYDMEMENGNMITTKVTRNVSRTNQLMPRMIQMWRRT